MIPLIIYLLLFVVFFSCVLRLVNSWLEMLRRSRSRKTPELGLRQIDEGWEILVLEMIVVTRAYSADFELPRNLLALCVCIVITPASPLSPPSGR